jgi:hypothetical protein
MAVRATQNTAVESSVQLFPSQITNSTIMKLSECFYNLLFQMVNARAEKMEEKEARISACFIKINNLLINYSYKT